MMLQAYLWFWQWKRVLDHALPIANSDDQMDHHQLQLGPIFNDAILDDLNVIL